MKSTKRYHSFMISDILDTEPTNNSINGTIRPASTTSIFQSVDNNQFSSLSPPSSLSSLYLSSFSSSLSAASPQNLGQLINHRNLRDQRFTSNWINSESLRLAYPDTRYAHIICGINFRKKLMLQSKPRKGGQIRFTHQQTICLEEKFNLYHFLNPSDRKLLADKLNLTEKQVKTWFQNRRAKQKRAKSWNYSEESSKESSCSNETNYFHPWSSEDESVNMETIGTVKLRSSL